MDDPPLVEARNLPSDSDPVTAQLRDEGLRCPKCAYNLTGLDDERCPECGTAFNREDLLYRRLPMPIPGWDDDALPFPLNFVGTCLMTWVRPYTFARRFPDVYNPRSVRRFRRIALLLALGVFAAASIMGELGYWFAVITAPGVLAGVFSCEYLLKPLFAAPRALNFRTPTAEQSSRGVVQCFRSYLIFSATLIGYVVWKNPTFLLGVSYPAIEAIVISYLLWWAGISMAICGTRQHFSDQLTAICMVPVVAGLAVLIAMAVSLLCSLLLAPSVR